MTEPLIDVVIAVHDKRRPVERAVRSLIGEKAGGGIRVTVVCHDLDPDPVRARLGDLPRETVRMIEHRDGVRSPAGPMNAGLAAATATFVAVMGSDDFFEPGATERYLTEAATTRADVVLMPLKRQSGGLLRNPLVRPGRRSCLDPVRDRLFYRSSPLALMRRELLRDRPAPFTEGLPAGVDLDFSTWLWTRSLRIDFPVDAPAYVIGADAHDRVTLAPRPAEIAMAPLLRLVTQPWVAELDAAVREALAIKIARIHLFAAVGQRPDASGWSADDHHAVVSVAAQLHELAPRLAGPFTRSEAALWQAILAGRAPSTLIELERRRTTDSWARRTLTGNPLRSLGRESMARRYLLYRLDRWDAA